MVVIWTRIYLILAFCVYILKLMIFMCSLLPCDDRVVIFPVKEVNHCTWGSQELHIKSTTPRILCWQEVQQAIAPDSGEDDGSIILSQHI
jgi:hypothetical protein